TAEEFANRVQKATADHLGLIASSFTVRDKAKLVRKWIRLREGKTIKKREQEQRKKQRDQEMKEKKERRKDRKERKEEVGRWRHMKKDKRKEKIDEERNADKMIQIEQKDQIIEQSSESTHDLEMSDSSPLNTEQVKLLIKHASSITPLDRGRTFGALMKNASKQQDFV
ncbi:MAG: hypothetical protein EZS28_054459, partial [Streblomastix strix]